MQIIGLKYPISDNPKGLMAAATGAAAIKSDLMQLILTNPGERVMLSDFGTGLRKLLFEQNNDILFEKIRSAIIEAISRWEPRVVLQEVIVTNQDNEATGTKIRDASEIIKNRKATLAELLPMNSKGITGYPRTNDQLDSNDIYIRIKFVCPDNIDAVESLEMKIPTGVNNV